MAPIDPHSFTDSSHPLATHISLVLYFDFSSSTILSSAVLSFPSPYSGDLFLDTRSLSIAAVFDPEKNSPLPFSLSPTVDPVKGLCLTVSLSNHSKFAVKFATSPTSSALQWLSRPQTFNKSFPLVYTQCQAIHARAVFPCQIGRTAFDEFIKRYIANFKFQSIDTDMFLNFLKANVPGIENEIDLKLWTEGTGLPPDAKGPIFDSYLKTLSLANEFKLGRMPSEDEVADWQGQEWELYLKNLPKSVEASEILALDARYRLAESKDYEVKVAFLQLAIASRCRDY